MIVQQPKIIDLFTLLKPDKDSAPEGVIKFLYEKFGELAKVKSLLDPIKEGDFLILKETQETESRKLSTKVGDVWITPQIEKDFLIHQGFTITIGDSTTPLKVLSLNFNIKKEQIYEKDLAAFFDYLVDKLQEVYKGQRFPEAEINKFFNILGKYFHQAGIGTTIQNYLYELGKQQMIFSQGHGDAIFDLTGIEKGVIKVIEKFTISSVIKADNPDVKTFSKSDDKGAEQPVAIFDFPFEIRLIKEGDKFTDKCAIEAMPLKVYIMDQATIKQTYMPAVTVIAPEEVVKVQNSAPFKKVITFRSTATTASGGGGGGEGMAPSTTTPPTTTTPPPTTPPPTTTTTK